jgi:hypothetical protein
MMTFSASFVWRFPQPANRSIFYLSILHAAIVRPPSPHQIATVTLYTPLGYHQTVKNWRSTAEPSFINNNASYRLTHESDKPLNCRRVRIAVIGSCLGVELFSSLPCCPELSSANPVARSPPALSEGVIPEALIRRHLTLSSFQEPLRAIGNFLITQYSFYDLGSPSVNSPFSEQRR